MLGRWANTIEMPSIAPESRIERLLIPDRVDIAPGGVEPLDCIVQFEREDVAFGWNNESAFTGGRNPRCKLKAGKYKVRVELSGQNFRQITTEFDIVVAEDSAKTSLSFAGK